MGTESVEKRRGAQKPARKKHFMRRKKKGVDIDFGKKRASKRSRETNPRKHTGKEGGEGAAK